MSDDVRLYWHPGFGAVLALDSESELEIADVLASCPFTEGMGREDVKFVKRRRFWWRGLGRRVGRRMRKA